MTGAGRPLRFLLGVAGGWTLLRVAMIWQSGATLPQAIREAVPLPLPQIAARAPQPAVAATLPRRAGLAAVATPALTRWQAPLPARQRDPVNVQFALLAMLQFGEAIPLAAAGAPARPAAVPVASTGYVQTPYALPPAPAAANRWSASGWLFVRSGGGARGAAPVPQLGGSQAGLRIDRAIGRDLALTARIASPLEGRGTDAAVGIALQPGGAPVRVTAEQRIGIDGARGGPSVGISGGVSDIALPARLRLEGYGQAGAIARSGIEGYADGAVRVARTVARIGRGTVDLGLGAWGAVQRDAARIDVGPGAALRLPHIGGGSRMSIDWRARVAGDAVPARGLTLTIGTDF